MTINNSDGSFMCACIDGYRGIDCRLPPCDSSTCSGHGKKNENNENLQLTHRTELMKFRCMQ